MRVGAQLDRVVTQLVDDFPSKEQYDRRKAVVDELYRAAYKEGFSDGLEQGHQDALVSYEGMEDE
jgi:hypothetical protein